MCAAERDGITRGGRPERGRTVELIWPRGKRATSVITLSAVTAFVFFKKSSHQVCRKMNMCVVPSTGAAAKLASESEQDTKVSS